MTHRMPRRAFGVLAGGGLVALATGPSALSAAGNKTLRFIVRTDLRVLYPLWTTAYVSRNRGYMGFHHLGPLQV